MKKFILKHIILFHADNNNLKLKIHANTLKGKQKMLLNFYM